MNLCLEYERLVMEIVLLLLCVPLYVLNSFCDKYVSTKNNSIINIVYNIVKFGLGSVIFFGLFLESPSKLEWGSFVCGVISGLMSSVADITIVTMQDIMRLGTEARMNTPGCAGGNWQWRMKNDVVFKDNTAERLAKITRLYGR